MDLLNFNPENFYAESAFMGGIRAGNGPENITLLRRFAIGLLKSIQKPTQTIASLMRDLSFRTRRVFDLLRLTKNSAPGYA